MKYQVSAFALLALLGLAACSSDEAPPQSSPLPIIETFDAAPAQIGPGETATLSWETSHATAVRIADAAGNALNLSGQSAAQGSVLVTPAAGTVYTLTAEGLGGEALARATVAVSGTPLVQHFAALPGKILPGETASLHWNVKETTRVRLQAGEEILLDTEEDFNGSLEVSPERTTTYTLIASFEDVETDAEATLLVQPQIDAFAAEQEGPVAPGTEVALSWQTRGAERLTLSNLEETVEIPTEGIARGETILGAGPSGTFRLVASSGDLETVEEISVLVRPLPAIFHFDAPEKVGASSDSPATITIAWKAEQADAVRLTITPGDTLDLAAEGEMELSIQETTTLLLSAENTVGAVEAERIVLASPPVAIVSFESSAEAIARGGSVTLDWEVLNASEIRLERDGVPLALVEGQTSLEDQPTETSTYRLTASDDLGASVSGELQVVVADALILATLEASPAAIPSGGMATLSWRVETAIPTAPILLSLVDEEGQALELTGKDPRNGSLELLLDETGTKTFTLSATSLGATTTAEATVVVAPGASITLAATPEALEPVDGGTEIVLSWSSENIASMEIFLVEGSQKTSLLVVPAAEIAEGSHTLTAKGASQLLAEGTSAEGVETSATYALSYGAPEILSFTASSREVAAGTTVTFNWNTRYGRTTFGDVRGGNQEVDLPYLDMDELAGQLLALKGCDGECEPFGFSRSVSFPYFGTSHSSLWVYRHGFVSFAAPHTWDDFYNPGDACLPIVWVGPEALDIAPYFSDLDTMGGDSGVWVAEGTDPTERRFIVFEWRDMEVFYDDGVANFQLVLWEDGTFDFRYGAMVGDDANGEAATVGYQDGDFENDWQLTCDDVVQGGLSNRSWQFFGPPPATGSAEIEITQSGPHTLCVTGYLGVEVCETIQIDIAP